MILSVFADVIVAVLLVATIGYAAVLNRRLGQLRGDRAKIEEMVNALTAATQRAEASIGSLRAISNELGGQLDKDVDQAKGLRDDLKFLIERGAALADRIEGNIRTRRDTIGIETRGPAKPDVKEAPKVAPVTPAAEVRSVKAATAKSNAPVADVPAPQRREIAPSRSERDLLRALATLR